MSKRLCDSISTITLLMIMLMTGAGCQARLHQPSVMHYGALHDLMHGESRAAVVDLQTYADHSGVYAVGALGDLAGEITILNGDVWISRPDGTNGFRTTQDVEHAGAALLVETRVGDGLVEWPIAVQLEQDTLLEELGAAVKRLAHASNLQVDEPFPFLIEAILPELDIHIVDGTKIKPGDTPEQHHEASVQRHYENVKATLIGFHSEKHMGIYTHRGQTVHMHAVIKSENVTGHVDGCLIPEGTIIRLSWVDIM